MKHNLVERGLAEYKVGLLYLLDRIIRRGKGYTSREGDATEILSRITPYFPGFERDTLATRFCLI